MPNVFGGVAFVPRLVHKFVLMEGKPKIVWTYNKFKLIFYKFRKVKDPKNERGDLTQIHRGFVGPAYL